MFAVTSGVSAPEVSSTWSFPPPIVSVSTSDVSTSGGHVAVSPETVHPPAPSPSVGGVDVSVNSTCPPTSRETVSVLTSLPASVKLVGVTTPARAGAAVESNKLLRQTPSVAERSQTARRNRYDRAPASLDGRAPNVMKVDMRERYARSVPHGLIFGE
jgi:hypothetical protein